METMTAENDPPRLSAWELRERMKSTRNELPISSRISSSSRSTPPRKTPLHNIDEVGLQKGLPSAGSAPPHLSAWEVRERMKNTRNQVPISTRISASPRSTHLHNIDEVGLQTGLPSAFRNVAQTSKRQDSSTHSDGSMELNSESKTKSKSDFKIRKKPVFDAISKYVDDDHSTIANTDDQDDKSTISYSSSRASLGSSPPLRRRHNISGYGKTNPSLNLSMGISEHTRDIQISSSAAADERWACFKLLGRIGLGDIEVPEEAKPLVECNVRILQKAIENIVALRDEDELNASMTLDTAISDFRSGTILDEVKKIVELPTQSKRRKRDVDSIELGATIQSQLEDYTTVIYSMYRANHFHNFGHASHVLKAVKKLVPQVVAPDDVDYNHIRYGGGVNTDPWTQFALIFSALIHDVDHSGVPNTQLIKEKSSVAASYKNKSVAEQNSIELAWSLLMEPCYKDLRECIFKTQTEMIRFRGLVVTAVMATDIADKELAAMRKGRALRAEDEDGSQKATFVLETLVQAADVSHTMGSFKEYKRWNHRLYKEMYTAYKSGRAGTDPTDTWYKGEFGFFDFYILPLARKLKSCGVFDEVCDDWLNNAMSNRKLWEAEGEALVAGFLEEMNPQPKITFTNMASMHSTVTGSNDASVVAISFHDEDDSISLESDVDISISSGESTLEVEKKEERRIAHRGRISASGGIGRISLAKKATKAKASKDDASKKKPVEEEKEEPPKVPKSSFVVPLATERVLITGSKSASGGGLSRTAALAKVFAKPGSSPKQPSEKPKVRRIDFRRTKSDDLANLVPEKAVEGPSKIAAIAKIFAQPEPSSKQPSEEPKIKRIGTRRTKSEDLTNLEPEEAAKKKKKKAGKSTDNKSEESDKAKKRPSVRRQKSSDALSSEKSSDELSSEEFGKAKKRPSVRRHKSSDEIPMSTNNLNSTPSLVKTPSLTKTRKAPTVKTDEKSIERSSSLDEGSDKQKSSSNRTGGEKIKRRIKRSLKPEKKEKAPAPTPT